MKSDKQTNPNRTARIDGRDTLYSGWFRLENITVAHTDSTGAADAFTRVIHDHGNGAACLPVDPHRKTALLVRQLRVPALYCGDDPYLLEACGGLVDGHETPMEAVQREAQEELRCAVFNLKLVAAPYMSPGVLTERVFCFIAEYDGTQVTNTIGGAEAEMEDIEIVEMPLAALEALSAQGRLLDAKLVLLTQYYKIHFPEYF